MCSSERNLLLTPRENKTIPTYMIEVKHLADTAEEASVAAALKEAHQQGIDTRKAKRFAIVYKDLKISAVAVA